MIRQTKPRELRGGETYEVGERVHNPMNGEICHVRKCALGRLELVSGPFKKPSDSLRYYSVLTFDISMKESEGVKNLSITRVDERDELMYREIERIIREHGGTA